MRVASSRLDIVNEADSLVQKTQQQADHFRKLKKKAMSLPVIGSIVGTVGGVLLIRMFAGKKSNPAPPPQPRTSGSWVNSSIFRFIVEILITLAFPSLKKMGIGLAGKKFLQAGSPVRLHSLTVRTARALIYSIFLSFLLMLIHSSRK